MKSKNLYAITILLTLGTGSLVMWKASLSDTKRSRETSSTIDQRWISRPPLKPVIETEPFPRARPSNPVDQQTYLQRDGSRYSDLNFNGALQEVQRLSGGMNALEFNEMAAFLRRHDIPVSWNADQVHALKDEMMTAIRMQENLNGEVTTLLVELFRDQSQDPVIRDYAIQHLSSWYAQADSKAEIRSVLWESLTLEDQSVSGTGLLAVRRLMESMPESFPRERVSREALRLLSSPSTCEESRIGAIQICGELKQVAALKVLIRMAKQGETIPIRMAAIGSLGNLGRSEVKPVLEQILEGGNRRLMIPAKRALQKLSEKSA